MSASPHDVRHLVNLIETAKAEAARLGPALQDVAGALDAAVASARAALGAGGQPDEGLRPEDLTTANDK